MTSCYYLGFVEISNRSRVVNYSFGSVIERKATIIGANILSMFTFAFEIDLEIWEWLGQMIAMLYHHSNVYVLVDW